MEYSSTNSVSVTPSEGNMVAQEEGECGYETSLELNISDEEMNKLEECAREHPHEENLFHAEDKQSDNVLTLEDDRRAEDMSLEEREDFVESDRRNKEALESDADAKIYQNRRIIAGVMLFTTILLAIVAGVIVVKAEDPSTSSPNKLSANSTGANSTDNISEPLPQINITHDIFDFP